MSTPLKDAKAVWRKAALVRRDALSPAARATRSARITEKLLALDSLRAARSVMAYMPIGSEFDTRALIEHVLASGKTLVLPRVAGPRRLALHAVHNVLTGLQAGVWGIREPRPECTPEVSLKNVDWILTPGVAFTHAGARLGYGGGYYDALLARIPASAVCIAAAFGVQVVDHLPLSERDFPVSQVITEQG